MIAEAANVVTSQECCSTDERSRARVSPPCTPIMTPIRIAAMITMPMTRISGLCDQR